MLRTLDDKVLSNLPHAEEFNVVVDRLGAQRSTEVQVYLDRLIDDLPSDRTTGRRKFNSAYLGSQLAPWTYPLLHLYDVARQLEGPHATDQEVKDRSGRLFGLFIWQRMMERHEVWVVYDPNLRARDQNRVSTGKIYFEP